MKAEKKSKTKKRKQAASRFDDAMRRVVRVPQPLIGTTNEDYKRANEEREKLDSK